MATKTLKTRIQVKYDTYTNWFNNNPTPLKGEICVVVVPAETGAVVQEPALLFKVGDGTSDFKTLPFTGAKAADVYSWAKAENKPTYQASEIEGLEAYIGDKVQDTNTKYKVVADANNSRKFYLQKKDLNDADYTTQDTFEIPAETVYTLVEGTENGTVKFNGTNVSVHGLGSAAYEDASAFDTAGAAQTAETNAKTYADGKDTAIAAAKKAGEDAQAAAEAAQTAADAAQGDVDALEGKVGTVTDGKTVVGLISEVKETATANANAIGVLKGGDTVDGSVAKQVKDAINEFATNVSEDGKVNTFKELVDYVAQHGSEYTDAIGDIATNKSDIATLKGDASTAGSVAKAVADAKAEMQTEIDKKVTAETGKGLISDAEKTKLAGIEEGADVNLIEIIKVGGTAAAISNKTVELGALAGKSEVAKDDLAAALKAELEAKAKDADLAAIAKSGNAIDLVQTEGDYLIFDCGTSATVI